MDQRRRSRQSRRNGGKQPIAWDADELADELDFDFATRTRLKITTIGAVDFPKRWRMKRAKTHDTERHKALRAKAGAEPHVLSLEQAKPWLDLVMSRATYFRRQREKRQGAFPIETRETDSSAAAKSLVVRRERSDRRAAACGVLARAVATLSAGDGVFYSETVKQERVFMWLRAREN